MVETQFFGAVDLGGTTMRIAVSDSLTSPNFIAIQKFPLSHNYENDLKLLIDTLQGFKLPLQAIGFAIPGVIDDQRTTTLDANHNHEWESQPFTNTIKEALDCPVILENDAAAAGLGEALYGMSCSQDFIYVTWGTGIGGDLVRFRDSKVFCERIDWNEYFATFENKVGGSKLAARFGKLIPELSESDWHLVMEDFVFEINQLCHKLKNHRVVLGGGATTKQRDRLSVIIPRLKSKGIGLTISNLGDNIGLYGALALITLHS